MQLTIRSGALAGRTIDVAGNEFTIGREAGCDLVLDDGKVSRRHAALRVLPDGRATLYDLGSSNGTFVNGQRIQSVLLSGNEQVQIGDTLLVPVPAANGAQAPAVIPATSAGVPAAPPPQPTPPAQPVVAQQAPPTQPLTPGQPPAGGPPPASGQPFGGFQPPTAQPMARPSRTQSAIQRIMLQRAVNRATYVGIVAIVLAVTVGVLAALGVFSGGSSETSNASIIAKAKPSTLFVVNNKGQSVGRGTGWVWDAGKGIIVTNAHVVAGGQQYFVAQGDHENITTGGGQIGVSPNGRPAKLLGEADCEDIGVLQVSDTSGLKTIPLGSQSQLRLGDRVVAAGYPATRNLATSDAFSEPGFTSGDLTASSGDVSQVQTTFQAIPGEGPGDPTVGPYKNVILTDTVINQGNSGGPLLNEKGQLVGMNSAARTDVVGQNYAIGVDRIKQIVPELIAGKNVCGG